MNSLIHKLGLSKKLGFQDVFSIDDPDLLAFVPRPAYALLLIFPVSETYENFRRAEDAGKEEYEGAGDGEPVVWYRQTIGNACGLIGLLHGVSNGVARSHIGMSKPYTTLSYLMKSWSESRNGCQKNAEYH
jgi:ubiquitin carboxyl-terminal hydrolase L3